MRHVPFDGVLMVAFGGPQGPADIRPFLANVLRGRRVPAERVEEVARHYLLPEILDDTVRLYEEAERARAA
jgi:ferrochelatase